MKKTDILFAVVWLVSGLTLTTLSFLTALDEFWSGMGSALIAVGVVRLFRGYRLNKSAAYREKRDVAENDERFRFIRNKAWAWAGFLFVIISAVCAIVFRILDQELLCIASGGAVCLMIVLYWISYFILNKKY